MSAQASSAKMTPEEAVKLVQQSGKVLRSRTAQGDHRSGADDRGDDDLPVCPRSLPDHRCARPGQDADGRHPGPGPGHEVQPHSVHPGPDALGHHGNRDHRGGRRQPQTPVPLRQGSDLRQHRAGRRDQPHAAQNPGRPAPGHAGIPGDGRLEHLRAGAAFLRDGHAEPDRAGRNLSLARGPARPFHVVDQHRLP